MSGKSDYLGDKVLDHVLGVASYTAPANLYIGLFTSSPGDDGSGTEVSGGSYARKLITFAAASGNQSANSNEITFDDPTGDWGTITHHAIYDASSGGNQLYDGEMQPAVVIDNGDDALVLAIGTVTITEE